MADWRGSQVVHRGHRHPPEHGHPEDVSAERMQTREGPGLVRLMDGGVLPPRLMEKETQVDANVVVAVE